MSEKHIVIVVASYNNERWYKKNLDSVFSQKYDNYRVIYVDDCSTDHTYELVHAYIQQNDKNNRITLIRNGCRRGSLANHYDAIYSCNEDDIIVILDGDDFLAHDDVLSYISGTYFSNDVWLTYGQFVRYPSYKLGHCYPMPSNIVKLDQHRYMYPFPFSHLRTFYAWLFKKIRRDDLLDKDGKFFMFAGDTAMMFPMVEMAKGHYKFISDILYLYNENNPINEHKVDFRRQWETAVYISTKPIYAALGSHKNIV